MPSDTPPLIFETHLGMLRPATPYAEAAMRQIQGRVRVDIKGGRANQRRRGLYWVIAAQVTELLNRKHGLDLTEAELHDKTREKLGLFDDVRLPSGDRIVRHHSTSNRAMNEAERAAYTDKALDLWSGWVGIDVTTLRDEAERQAA